MDNQSLSQQDRFWHLLTKKLCKNATPAELGAYDSLLVSHPEWQTQADMLEQMWNQRTVPAHGSESEEAYIKHLVRYKEILFTSETTGYDTVDAAAINTDAEQNQNKTGYRRGRSFLINWKTISGAAVLVAAFGWLFLSPKQPTAAVPVKQPITSSVTTKNGNRTKMVLPDGSQVWLNAGSRLDYNDKEYNQKTREVSLSGEAFFDVMKDKEKPFIIHTAKVNIRVLGTAFNVKSYPGEKITETSLIRGSVEVTVNSRPTEKFVLRPNEKLLITHEQKAGARSLPEPEKLAKNRPSIPQPIVAISSLSYLPADSTIIETSWMENKFIFRSEEFEELAKRMERWYGVTIQFRNETVKKEKLTGVFETETIETAIKALQMTVPFKYKMNKNEMIIY
jgi:transmembrane sensor